MHWFEVILTALAWAVQIGCTMLLAALLTAAFVWGTETLIRKRWGKFLPRFLIVLLLLCAVLIALAVRPPVVCAEHCRNDLTEEWRETVRSVSSGLYSWNVPLVPICVHITETEEFMVNGVAEYRIEFDVYYFCFGRLGMEYSTYEGFNIATPIFRS